MFLIIITVVVIIVIIVVIIIVMIYRYKRKMEAILDEDDEIQSSKRAKFEEVRLETHYRERFTRR